MMQRQYPGELQASIGIKFCCKYGHLISKKQAIGSSGDD